MLGEQVGRRTKRSKGQERREDVERDRITIRTYVKIKREETREEK